MKKYEIGTKVKLSPSSGYYDYQLQKDEDGNELVGEIIKNTSSKPLIYEVQYSNRYCNGYSHEDLILVENIEPVYEIY